MSSSVKAAVFDLGGTLWFDTGARTPRELAEIEARRLEPVFRVWGIEPPPDLASLAADVWAVVNEAYGAEFERGTFRDASVPFLWRGALATVGIDITERQAEALWRAGWLPREHFGVQLYPDALDVLAALKRQGLFIALNTTRPCTAGMMAADLEGCGIGRYADAVVCSGDVGYFKPHPAPFERALQLLGVAASDAVMVGDSAEHDIRGARAIGMRTVLKLNGRHGLPPCQDADFEIHDLAELLALPLLPHPRGDAVESPTPHGDGNDDRY